MYCRTYKTYLQLSYNTYWIFLNICMYVYQTFTNQYIIFQQVLSQCVKSGSSATVHVQFTCCARHLKLKNKWKIKYCGRQHCSTNACGFSLNDTFSYSWTVTPARYYTGCPRRNVPDCGRVFLMLKYTDITQNTYVQSWAVTEIMAREKCGLLAGPRPVPVSWQVLSMSVLQCGVKLRLRCEWLRQCWHTCVVYSAWNTEDNYDMSASVFVVQFNDFMSLTS
jgi:hypothetical protein